MDIYTDGACSNNFATKKESPGGWGVICIDDNNKKIITHGGFSKDTTNNIMEMDAFIFGLKLAVSNGGGRIFTDSAYIVNCLSQKWYLGWRKNGWVNSKKEPVKNREKWEEILDIYLKNEKTIEIIKVKGHSGNFYNTLADKAAVHCKENQSNYFSSVDI